MISSNLWMMKYIFYFLFFPGKSPVERSSSFTSLEQLLRATWEADSWAIVLGKFLKWNITVNF